MYNLISSVYWNSLEGEIKNNAHIALDIIIQKRGQFST